MPTICDHSHINDAAIAANCVASSGTPRNSPRPHLRRALRSLAPHIFSASQVKRGKPAPDLFLFAAGQMQTRLRAAW